MSWNSVARPGMSQLGFVAVQRFLKCLQLFLKIDVQGRWVLSAIIIIIHSGFPFKIVMPCAMAAVALEAHRYHYSKFIPMRYLFYIKRPPILQLQQNQKPRWESQANGLLRDDIFEEEPPIPLRSNSNIDVSFYGCLLQACGNTKLLDQIHAQMLITGLGQNVYLLTQLVKMYAKRGNLGNARLVADRVIERNVFLWNAIIRGHASSGFWEETLSLYNQMQQECIQPDNFTFPFVLKACAGLSALREGKKIHYHVIRTGFGSDVFVATALIDMYCKCSLIEDARHMFDKMSERDVVSWSAMIAGYSQNGRADDALTLFNQMQLADVKPNSVTIASVLPACAQLGDMQQGKRIHDYAIRSGLEQDVSVGTALIDMYAKCGSVEVARQLFDKMCERNVVTWGAMIAGHAQNGYADEALKLFHQMQLSYVKPDPIALVSVLQGCAHLGALQQGKWMHNYLIRSGFGSDVSVGTGLIDMYAKCGSVEAARQFFDRMPERNVISWSAMIAGYGMHGHGEDALALFSKMQQTGMKPDHVTFICVLSTCSHAGLVDEGWHYFDCMSRDYCIPPTTKHYACMVDLLGRAGHLDEAQKFIEGMPLKPDAGVWGALLSACRIQGSIELGEYAAERLSDLEPENSGYYVLLSNIYAAAGRWDDVAKIRAMIKERGLKKTPGCSLIEVNNKVHAFLMGDRSHPQSDQIYAMLETLARQMEEAGHVPNTNFVLHDVNEEVKEDMLCSHSEKLALAFGLINTIPGTPIRITKNLRVCGDCHNALKLISKIVNRKIVARDINRFHHFKDGLCSCGDYW